MRSELIGIFYIAKIGKPSGLFQIYKLSCLSDMGDTGHIALADVSGLHGVKYSPVFYDCLPEAAFCFK